jgi:hypothetical protein
MRSSRYPGRGTGSATSAGSSGPEVPSMGATWFKRIANIHELLGSLFSYL